MTRTSSEPIASPQLNQTCLPGPTLHTMISSSWTVAAIWWLQTYFDMPDGDDKLFFRPHVHVRRCIEESRRLLERRREGRLQPWDDNP